MQHRQNCVASICSADAAGCLSNTMDENQEHERRLMDYVRKSCALTSDNISRSALESLILHGDGLTPKERVKFLLFLKEKVH